MVVPEEATLLMEGVAKGGYPVDITAQSTVDFTGLDPSELGCASALIESGLDPGAVVQLEVGYAVLETQESYSEEQDFPSSITEVIRPMEMAELVDILPTLSLIEEETPSGPSTPSVLDMLESFGLGVGEKETFFDFENSAGGASETHCEGTDTPASYDTADATGGDVPVLSLDFNPGDTETLQVPRKGASFPLRNQVEWDRPAD